MRNWRVRNKLIAVLVIPTAAFLVLAGINIATSVQNARAFDQRADLAELAREVAALTHALQLERDLVAGFMTAGGAGDAEALSTQQSSVDQRVSAYRDAEARLSGSLGESVQGRFVAARTALGQIGPLREATGAGALTRQAAFNEYTQIIATLLDVDSELARQSENEALARNARAFSDLSRAKEAATQVRGTLYAISLRNGFTFGEFQDFADLLAARDAALAQFQADASERQRALFANVVQGQAVLAVGRIEEAAVNRQSSTDLDIDPAQWLAASTTQVELLRTVETELLDGVVAQARDLASAAQRESVATVVAIAVTVTVALAASLAVARSMARSLQRLRRAAQDVAGTRLPQAVEQMRTTRTGGLDLRVAPVGVTTDDEIGEVAGAFDTVHREAVRLAAEQAALRRSINDMFVNLARRNQTLIDRQLNMIEELEHDTEDPSELSELFTLDHLATRMRRNQENLLVLASADPAARSSEPVALADLLREALGEVEDYTRVELLTSDDVQVVGYATSDVVHLLAELIENATMFSPPHTPVRIASQAAANGYLIEIEDQGTGMSDDDLVEANERLEEPPEIDLALSRRLGFFVVGRLAQRHGIRVQLRHSWYGGVTALVLLPDRLFQTGAVPDPVALAGRTGTTLEFHPPVGEPGVVAGPAPGDRSYTPRAAALAHVSRAARSTPAAGPPAPGGGAGGDRADEGAAGPPRDPTADLRRRQRRLVARLEPPPPLSPPVSGFRRRDDESG